MTALSDQASTAERTQSWIKTIIKCHVQILRSKLKRYYVLRIAQQSLFALDEITDLHQDIIYQHQFRNGKIISFPKYRIVDPMTTTEELLTTMPSTTSLDITTISTPAGLLFDSQHKPRQLPQKNKRWPQAQKKQWNL